MMCDAADACCCPTCIETLTYSFRRMEVSATEARGGLDGSAAHGCHTACTASFASADRMHAVNPHFQYFPIARELSSRIYCRRRRARGARLAHDSFI